MKEILTERKCQKRLKTSSYGNTIYFGNNIKILHILDLDELLVIDQTDKNMDEKQEPCVIILYSWIYMGIISIVLLIFGLAIDVAFKLENANWSPLFIYILPISGFILYGIVLITTLRWSCKRSVHIIDINEDTKLLNPTIISSQVL